MTKNLIAWDGTKDGFEKALLAVERNRHVESDLAVLYEVLGIAISAIQSPNAEQKAHIADKLMEARKALNITQAELARRMDMAPVMIYRHEKGIVTPNTATLKRYAETLYKSVDWFLM